MTENSGLLQKSGLFRIKERQYSFILTFFPSSFLQPIDTQEKKIMSNLKVVDSNFGNYRFLCKEKLFLTFRLFLLNTSLMQDPLLESIEILPLWSDCTMQRE